MTSAAAGPAPPHDGAPTTGHWRLDLLTTALAMRLLVHPASSEPMMRYWMACATPSPEKPLTVPAMIQLLRHLALDTRLVDLELYLVGKVAVSRLFAHDSEWTGFTSDSLKHPCLKPIARIIGQLINPRTPWDETGRPFLNLAGTGIGGEIRGRVFRGNERFAYYIDRGSLLLLACTLWVETTIGLEPAPDASVQRYAWQSVSMTLSELAPHMTNEHEKTALTTLSQWFDQWMLDSGKLAELLRMHLTRAQETLRSRYHGYAQAMQEELEGGESE